MTSNQKRRAIIVLGLSVLVTILFATSLSQMEIKPGLPAPLLEGYHFIVPKSDVSSRIDLPVLTFILRILGITSCIYLLVMLYRIIMGMRLKS